MARLLILRELAQVDIKGLTEPEQQGHGDRALVVLDQVEVARRYLELFGQFRLVQAQILPETADFMAKHRFLVRHGCALEIYKIYIISNRIFTKYTA